MPSANEPFPSTTIRSSPAAEPGQPSPASEDGPDANRTLTDSASAPGAAARLHWPQVAGYEILSELGRGGMGVVFKARHEKLKRLVALKMLRDSALAGPEELVRFRLEAEALAHLHHPHIVHIYEVNEQAGQRYFALEFVEGGTLAQKLAGTPQPAHRAAALVQILARAVHSAHQRGVVHRDLKPANVLLAPSDSTQGIDLGSPAVAEHYALKITDFGLAKRLEGAPGLSTPGGQTQSGAIMGTPSYMAPEQAAGEGKHVGPAADVYALGAILYELLTGRPPFKAATTLDTILLVLSADPVPPRRFQPGLPRDLETICLKCLHKDPRKRYAGAEELAEDLRRFLGGEPIQARPAGAWERAWKWVRRHPSRAALAAVSCVGILGLLVLTFLWQAARQGAVIQRIRLQAERKAAVQKVRLEGERKTAVHKVHLQAARKAANERARVARQFRYLASTQLIRKGLERGDAGNALEWLRDLRPGAGRPDLRNFEWYYFWHLCHGERLTLRGQMARVNAVAFAPSGAKVATGHQDGTVMLWDTATGMERAALKGHTAAVLSLAFAPAENQLASASGDTTVRLWDLDAGRARVALRGHTAPVHAVAFAADGKAIATGSADQTVRLWEPTTGKQTACYRGHTAEVFSVAVAPNDKLVASADKEGVVKLWDRAAGSAAATLNADPDGVHSVAFSPDGKTLATAGRDRTAKLWDLGRRRVSATLVGHAGIIWQVQFAPDGKTLATAGSEGTVRMWEVASGRLRFTVRGHGNQDEGTRCLAFSRDGLTLATGSRGDTAKLWDLAALAGWEGQALAHPHPVGAVAFSPDGRTLAAGSADHHIHLWDVRRGTRRAVLRGHQAEVLSVAFSPDGTMLASGGDDHTVRLWDVSGRKQRAVLRGHRQTVYTVAFSPDGRSLASGGGDANRPRSAEARVWDVAAARKLLTLAVTGRIVHALAFAPDGRTLASGGIGALENNPRAAELKLWDLTTGRIKASLLGHRAFVLGLAFAPKGNRLASSSWDRTIRLWDSATLREERVLKGHTGLVVGVAFTPDGQRLASAGGEDGTVKLWDVETGMEMAAFQGRQENVHAVAFSPDGRTLASAGGDPRRLSHAEVILWRAATDREVAAREKEAAGPPVQGHGTVPTIIFLGQIPAAVSTNSNRLIRRHHETLRVTASSEWPNWGAWHLIDGDEHTSWCSAHGDFVARGKHPWVEVKFARPVTVQRVTVLGNRGRKYSILKARIELYDKTGRRVAFTGLEGAGAWHDFDWRPEKPVTEVQRVRVVSLADQGAVNDEGCVCLGELLIE